jgi:hypothetical protein
MESVVVIGTLVLSVVLAGLAYIFGIRSGAKASDQEMMALREEARGLEDKLVETLSDNNRVVSLKQLEDLHLQAQRFMESVEQQKAEVDSIAEKLDSTRSEVRRREEALQDLRSLKEQDEVAIAQSLAAYNDSSTESVGLEQKLAESLRSLDTMSGEIKMNADQQAVFQELSNSLTSASAQLRDVIIDYQNANERLANLNSRFVDLEREYSKLVEQQLAV